MEQHAEVLIGGSWHQRVPTWRDTVATLLVLAIVILLGSGAHQALLEALSGRLPVRCSIAGSRYMSRPKV